MSEDSVELIIGRAVTDQEFRELLFTDPDEAISGYELTQEETMLIKNIAPDRFEAVRSELEERLSKAGFTAASFTTAISKWTGPEVRLAAFTKNIMNPPTVTDEF